MRSSAATLLAFALAAQTSDAAITSATQDEDVFQVTYTLAAGECLAVKFNVSQAPNCLVHVVITQKKRTRLSCACGHPLSAPIAF